MSRMLFAAAIAAVAATAAQAHVSLEAGEAPAGSAYKAVLRVPHGCEGEATLKRAGIPEGVIAVKPMPKPGWTIGRSGEAYAHPYDYFGSQVTEGVTEIAWSGALPDDYYDEFAFRATLTEALGVGSEALPDRRRSQP